jgi:hypothetical protein
VFRSIMQISRAFFEKDLVAKGNEIKRVRVLISYGKHLCMHPLISETIKFLPWNNRMRR